MKKNKLKEEIIFQKELLKRYQNKHKLTIEGLNI